MRTTQPRGRGRCIHEDEDHTSTTVRMTHPRQGGQRVHEDEDDTSMDGEDNVSAMARTTCLPRRGRGRRDSEDEDDTTARTRMAPRRRRQGDEVTARMRGDGRVGDDTDDDDPYPLLVSPFPPPTYSHLTFGTRTATARVPLTHRHVYHHSQMTRTGTIRTHAGPRTNTQGKKGMARMARMARTTSARGPRSMSTTPSASQQ
jgi:hypothetical protein